MNIQSFKRKYIMLVGTIACNTNLWWWSRRQRRFGISHPHRTYSYLSHPFCTIGTINVIDTFTHHTVDGFINKSWRLKCKITIIDKKISTTVLVNYNSPGVGWWLHRKRSTSNVEWGYTEGTTTYYKMYRFRNGLRSSDRHLFFMKMTKRWWFPRKPFILF